MGVDPSHQQKSGCARQFGFSKSRWQTLSLLRQALMHPCCSHFAGQFGGVAAVKTVSKNKDTKQLCGLAAI
jgi:hypothetical protein